MMHYYQFHIGDYQRDTAHLTPIEDIAYRRLLDRFYLDERPLQREGIARKIGMREYEADVLTVFNEFFIEVDGGWINKRAQEQVQQYQGFKVAGMRGAAKRWSKGEDSLPISPPNEGLIANHKPITNNHKPKEEREEVDKTRFVTPSKQETADFFISNGSTIEEAGKFWYHFDSNGWKVGGRTKMKSWTSAAKKWILTAKTNVTTNGHAKRNGTLGYQQPITAADLPDIMQSIADDPRYA